MDTTLPTRIDLEVVTPERRVLSTTVQGVTLPGASGELGILPGHAPLVSELSPGVLSYEEKGSERMLAISSGFAEVLQGRVIVLVETAEAAEDIDVERAKAALERATARLKKPVVSEAGMKETAEAQSDLARAAARIAVATRLSAERIQGRSSDVA